MTINTEPYKKNTLQGLKSADILVLQIARRTTLLAFLWKYNAIQN